jgi:hypothetical protein
MRLTVHIENAPFIKKQQKLIGKNEIGRPINKPKKPECIINTLSFRNLKSLKEVTKKLAHIRSNYKIAKWKEGPKKRKEMIYLSWE